MACQMCRGKITLGIVSALSINASSLASDQGGPFTPAGPLGGLWLGGSGNWSNPSNWNQTASPQLLSGHVAVIDGGNPGNSLVNMDLNVALHALHVDAGDRVSILGGRWLLMTTEGDAPLLDCAGEVELKGPSQILLDEGVAMVLNGGGVLRLGSSAQSVVGGVRGNEILINVENAIAGAGALGDDTLTIVNGGTIDADVFELKLTVDPGHGGVLNNGLMQASGGGRLRLAGGDFSNPGVIRAGERSFVEVEGANIIGGTLAAEGDGFFRTMSTPSSLRDVVINAPYELGLTQLTMAGNVRNNGQFVTVAGSSVNDAGIVEILVPPGTGDLTLDGYGEIEMELCKIHSGSTASAGRLINGVDHAIIGDGMLGANTVGLVNHGLIHANHYGPIIIDPPNSLVVQNTGTMRASGYGGIAISGATFHNTGVLEVQDASRIAMTANVTLVNNVGGTLTGGTWRVLADGHPTYMALWNGTLFQNDADVLLSGVGSFFNALNGMASNTGSFALRNGRKFTTTSSFFTNADVLDLGANCLFTVNGAFAQVASGRLVIEVNGEAGNGVTVNGTATLGGVLEIRVAEGAQNHVGQVVDVLRATNITGSFSQIITPWGVQAQVAGSAVRVAINQTCEGDTNGDGIVNVDDLLTLVQTWEHCPPAPEPCEADLDGSGVVDINDLLEIVNGWGACP